MFMIQEDAEASYFLKYFSDWVKVSLFITII